MFKWNVHFTYGHDIVNGSIIPFINLPNSAIRGISGNKKAGVAKALDVVSSWGVTHPAPGLIKKA